MRRDEALAILAAHKDEMAARYGVHSLALFGSVARDEAGPDSDVDVLVEFDETPSLLRLIAAEHYLSDLLGAKVDLVMRRALREAVAARVARDVVAV